MRFESQTIVPLIDGLSIVSDLKITAGTNKQVKNLENGIYSYEPDRTDGSGYCVVKPYVSVIDPNNVSWGDQPITSAVWYWNGTQIIPSQVPSSDGLEVNSNEHALKVKLNVLENSTSVLKCVYTFTDRRTGVSITLTRTMDFTTTIFNADEYKLYVGCGSFHATSAKRENSDNLVKNIPLTMHRGKDKLNTGVVYRLFEFDGETWMPVSATAAADYPWLRSVIDDANGTLHVTTTAGVDTCSLSVDFWMLPDGIKRLRIYALPQGRTTYKEIWMREITLALDVGKTIGGWTKWSKGTAIRSVNQTTPMEASLIVTDNKVEFANPEREYACRWLKVNGDAKEVVCHGFDLETDTFELEMRRMTDMANIAPDINYLGCYKLITCNGAALQDGDNALIVSH